MKGKIVKNTLDSVINVLSNKNTDEVRSYSRKKLLKAMPFFATGGTLHLLNVTGSTPIEVLNIFNEFNIDISNSYFALYGVGSLLMLSKNEDLPIQEEISQYGSDYCPYESFSVANNDLKAKSIQMKINTLHNLSFKLGGKSFLGTTIKSTANISESLMTSIGAKSKKLFDFFGKGEFGFELLTHRNNNPRLISELPIPLVLKEILRPSTLDLDNQYKIEERKMVFEIRERAMVKTRESVNERNVFLAIVKVIDKIKSEDFSMKDLRILDKLMILSKLTSKGTLEKYKGVSDLMNILVKENKVLDLKGLSIPFWDKDQSLHMRCYHILNELNKISFRNELENIKNPMIYREIYRNNLIMAVQFKMRSTYEQENIALNNSVPLVREHFENTHKNYFKDLSKFRITKMLGIKEEDYPICYFLKKNKNTGFVLDSVLGKYVSEEENKKPRKLKRR